MHYSKDVNHTKGTKTVEFETIRNCEVVNINVNSTILH